MEHNGESLLWNVKVFSNMGANDDITGIVKHINKYWSLLPTSRQDAIFSIYKEAHEAISEIEDVVRLLGTLRGIVKRLYAEHPWEEMDAFARSCKIKLPDGLKKVHGVDAPDTPQTYLEHEYVGLLVLIFQLRVMLPIWGAHVHRVTPDVGSEFKELHVRSVINTSRLVDCPYYLRYKAYVDKFIGEQGDQMTLPVVLNHMGSNTIPDYMLAISMIRRLTCCYMVDWSMNAEAVNVISTVYNYIRNKSEQGPKTFSGGVMIREKLPEGSDKPDAPDNTSRAEAFKIRAPISPATLETYGVFLSNIAHVVKRTDDSINPDIVQALIAEYSSVVFGGVGREPTDPTDVQLVLVQWVLRVVVPARSVPYLDWHSSQCAVVATAILLTHWGFDDLALMLMGTSVPIKDVMMLGNRRTNFTNEEVAELAKLYPHYQMPKVGRDQRRVDNPDMLLKQNIAHNVAIQDINELVRLYGQSEWIIPETVSAFTRKTMSMGRSAYTIPDTIKNQLAALVILTARLFKKHKDNRGQQC
jgi:hypothetical protein